MTRGTGGIIAALGFGLAAFVLLTAARASDMAYWLVVSYPAVLSTALGAAGVQLARGRLVPDRFVRRLLAWTAVGVLALSVLATWLFFFAVGYLGQTPLEPPVALLTVAVFGALVGLVVGVYDARGLERKHALKRRKRELVEQNRRLDEFASVVTHDLRNPLNLAVGHLGLAREEWDNHDLEQVADALSSMDTLIVDLLTLARQGKTVDEVRAVPLPDVVEEAWSTVSTPTGTLRVDDDPGVVSCDPARLRQLLENLFRNSVEHGGDDVTVTVGRTDGGFYVADDGTGIPAERREEVFDLGHSTNQDGTGLGLTIVRSIAEAHGWDVEIARSDEGGVRFEFSGVVMDDPAAPPS